MSNHQCPLCHDESPAQYWPEVWNAPGRSVMYCKGCESYFLHPQLTERDQQAFDREYDNYIADRAKLVSQYTEETFDSLVDDSIEERFQDIAEWFESGVSVLEIGAEKGGFLDRIAPVVGEVSAVDACPEYTDILQGKGYSAYRYVWDVPADKQYDRICLFSLLEHIPDPRPFLARLHQCLQPGGYMIIEIPSAKEPLISLYDIPAFKSFYFQSMHPYVYSVKAASLVLREVGFEVSKVQYKQRYGLSNHLNWLKAGAPGGDACFTSLFEGAADQEYCRALEASGHTDSVYIVATVPK